MGEAGTGKGLVGFQVNLLLLCGLGQSHKVTGKRKQRRFSFAEERETSILGYIYSIK